MDLLHKYFDKDFPEGFLSLYGAKTVLLIASGFLGIFLPIFLFNLFDGDIKLVVGYFGLASLIYLFTVPLGALFLNKFGFRNALRLSVLWGVLFYIIFYFIGDENYIYLIPISIIILVLFRLFYWLPYHVDFAKFTDNEDRGRQLSILSVTGDIITSLVPILSGFLITRFDYGPVFIIAIFLYLLSGLFYINIPRTKEKFDWTYFQSWSEFLSKKNRITVFAFISDGIEGLIGGTVWPIFIFLLLKGDYFKVGYVSALIIIMTIILQLLLGNQLDKRGRKKSILKLGSFFYSFGWIIKIFVVTAFHIFVIGIYHNVAKIFSRTTFDVITYDMAASQGHYVDEFTVLHEMSIYTGRVIAVIFVILLSFYLPLQWTFLIAATSSIFMNAIRNGNNLKISNVKNK